VFKVDKGYIIGFTLLGLCAFRVRDFRKKGLNWLSVKGFLG
jgi:hypothetical protein